MRRRREAFALMLACCASMAAAAATAAATALEGGPPGALPDTGTPLPVRNLSPSTALFGLPRARGLLSRSALETAVLVEHANNFTADQGDAAAVYFDGSTTVTSVALRGALDGRWEWGAEVPWVHHSGGFTDGFVEHFHDLFGLPGGGREHAPRNVLDYRIDHAGSPPVVVQESGGHLGDVRGWLGYRLHRSPAREAVVRATVKAPTGRVEDLSGSGGTDVSLGMALVDGALLESLSVTVTLMGAVTVPGAGDFAEADRETLVFSGHLGLHYPLTSALVLRAQLDGHSDVIDASIRELAQGSLMGTLGGTLALSSRTWLDLGVTEDLTVGSAPDVVFLLTLGARL